MRLRKLSILVLVFVLPLLAVSAYADSLGPDLSTFAVLGPSLVSNASIGGPQATLVIGNLGSATSVTGFPPGKVNGTINPGDLAAAQGQLTAANTTLGGMADTQPHILAGGLSGNTFGPGVYSVTSAAFDLTGTVFLNDGGVKNSVFIFKMDGTLITSPDAVVNVLGLDPTDSLFWIVPDAVTLGDRTKFEGNMIALNLIAFDPGAQDPCGRALSLTKAVTFAGASPATTGVPNLVGSGCGSMTGTTGGGFNGGGGTPIPTPEPGTFALLSSGLAIGLLTLRKLR